MTKIVILSIDKKTGVIKAGTAKFDSDKEAIASIKTAGAYAFLEVHEIDPKKPPSMSNVLTKITARAKLIRKAQPNKKWTDCIKQASRELKSGKATGTTAKKGVKKAATKKRKPSATRQTGVSKLTVDRKRKAKAPGKRLVKHAGAKSTVYYERRKNRSDKPGQLAGVSSATLKTALRNRLEEKLGKTFVDKTKATTKRAATKIQKSITAIKAELRKLK